MTLQVARFGLRTRNLPAAIEWYSKALGARVNIPDRNEVEVTCDNFPSKADCQEFMRSAEMAEAMQPPVFRGEFDPEELLRLRRSGASPSVMARIGLPASEE